MGTATFRGLVPGVKYDEAAVNVRRLAAAGVDVDTALQKDAAFNAQFGTRLADKITADNQTGFWMVVLIGSGFGHHRHIRGLAAGAYHREVILPRFSPPGRDNISRSFTPIRWRTDVRQRTRTSNDSFR